MKTALALFALAGAAAAAEPEPALRVATWNLGMAGESPRIQAELGRLAERSDVLALQEVRPPEAVRDPIAGWAARRGWSYAAKESNAVASRRPILRSGFIAANPTWSRDLPWAEIETPAGERYRIYSVHLSFKRGPNPFIGAARGVEAVRLARDARAFDGPALLAGDFNSLGALLWGEAREPGLRLLRRWGYVDATRNLAGETHYLGRLDWIYARGLDASRAELGRSLDSDHRWLWAELRPAAAAPSDPARGFQPNWRQGAALALVAWATLRWGRRRRRDTVTK